MLFTNKNDTKTSIIFCLSRGAVLSTELQTYISKKQKITKQAFYKALRELIEEEVVIKNRKKVILNNGWISQLHDFIASTDNTYTHENTDLLGLKEGESIAHYFNSLSSLNKLWMHYFFIGAKNYVTDDIVFYNRHNFWILFRNEAENRMFKWINDHERKAYLIVGDNTPLDRSTTRNVKHFNIDIHHEEKPSFEKHHYSLTVIGDYIIDTTLDANTATAIDRLYRKHPTWNETVARELDVIMSHLKRSKIVIKKDKKKATLIKKKLMKYFIFYNPRIAE